MPVTPQRQTIVEFDSETVANLKESAYWHTLAMEQISKGDVSNPAKIVLLPQIGWQIAAFNRYASYIHEGTEVDPGITTLTTPSGFTIFNAFRKDSDLPNVGGGGLKDTGDPFHQKRVADDDNWDDLAYRLGADQTAFPSPDTSSDNYPMDRVAVASGNHLPTQKITFRFYVPGIEGKASQALIALCFSGISSRTFREYDSLGFGGTGQYCLKLYGDGQAKLFELTSAGGWVVRKNMAWTPASKVVGNWHEVTIASDARFDGTTYTGTRIGFQFQTVSNLLNAMVGLAVAALGGPEWQFYVPERFGAANPTVAPVRIDVRRNVRASFQVSTAVYFPEAELRTVTFGLPFMPMDTDIPIRFEFYGDVPSGTNVSIQMYNAADDTALTVVDSGAVLSDKGYSTFEPVVNQSRYYAILTLTASGSQEDTPTVTRINAIREQAFKEGDAEPFEVEKKDKISITGQWADPTHETASLIVHDRSGTTFPLYFRSGQPIKIKTRYSTADPTLFSTLFMGHVAVAKTNRRARRRTRGFSQVAKPESERWRTYRVTATGEWKRLYEMQLPKTFDFGLDPNALTKGVPYKVTDVIRILLESVYPTFMVDVPDIDLRLFTSDNSSWLLEVHTEIGSIVTSLARDYLGAYLIFDHNATNGGPEGNEYGCWRLIIPPRAPYVNLAEFIYEPNFEGPRSSVNLENYVPDTSGDQTIKRVPIFKEPDEWTIPPEGNVVYVQGATPDGTGSMVTAGGGKELLQAWCFNPDSVRINEGQPPADTSHPDYLGYVKMIFLSDPGLQTPRAVQFAARRIYDLAAHAQRRMSFEAPLVLVTKDSDPLQIRPRMLRFGDPVLVDGVQYIIDSCNPLTDSSHGGDRKQTAQYEVFTVPALTLSENFENMVQVGLSLFGMAA